MTEWVKTEHEVPEHYDEWREMTLPARTMTYWHTKDCIEWSKAHKAAAAEYEAKWPNYCKKCGGMRGDTHYENGAPHGCGYWAMPVSEPCEDCYDKCSRCGVDLNEVLPDSLLVEEVLRRLDNDVALAKQNGYYFNTYWMEYLDKVEIWYEQEMPCPVCGWNWGKGKDDYHPGDEDECFCWDRKDYPGRDHNPGVDDWLESAYEDRTYIPD